MQWTGKGTLRIKGGKLLHYGDEIPADALSKESKVKFEKEGLVGTVTIKKKSETATQESKKYGNTSDKK